MADHETEEEQMRALKEWWEENGRSVMAGIVIGIGTLVGWKGWNVYQEQQALEASNLYSTMRSSMLNQNLDAVLTQAEKLKQEYKSTPYAALGALLIARAKAEDDDSSAIIENLQWAIDNGKQETIVTLAKLRLARTYISGNELEKAQSLLDQDYPEAYQSLLQELRGD